MYKCSHNESTQFYVMPFFKMKNDDKNFRKQMEAKFINKFKPELNCDIYSPLNCIAKRDKMHVNFSLLLMKLCLCIAQFLLKYYCLDNVLNCVYFSSRI